MESRIAEVIKPLTTLETDFKSKGAFPHLSRLHNLPLAYISLVLEYRWRHQFGAHFASWCKQLNEAIGAIILPERERRAEVNKDISGLNFITLWGLKESSSPYCDFSIFSGAEVLEKLVVDDTMLDGELLLKSCVLICRAGSMGQRSIEGGGYVFQSRTQAGCDTADGSAASR
jgi:hypothetical protein